MERFGKVWRGFRSGNVVFFEWWSSFREWSSSFGEVWRVGFKRFEEVWKGLERFGEVWRGFGSGSVVFIFEWSSSFRDWRSSFAEVWRVFRSGRVGLESVKVMLDHEFWSFREFWRGLKSFPEWSSSFGEWLTSFGEWLTSFEEFLRVGGRRRGEGVVYFFSVG